MTSQELLDTRPARFMTWFSLAFTTATDLAFVAVIRSEGGSASDIARVIFVAGFILLMAAMLVASLNRGWRGEVRLVMRAGAAGGLLVLGVLALFSIGLPLLIGGVMAAGATVRTLAGPHLTASALASAASAAIAAVVLVAGFEVTERMIFCPAHGLESGAGYGIVTGGYHYQCVDGRLNLRSGFCSNGGATVDSNGNVISTSSC